MSVPYHKLMKTRLDFQRQFNLDIRDLLFDDVEMYVKMLNEETKERNKKLQAVADKKSRDLASRKSKQDFEKSFVKYKT